MSRAAGRRGARVAARAPLDEPRRELADELRLLRLQGLVDERQAGGLASVYRDLSAIGIPLEVIAGGLVLLETEGIDAARAYILRRRGS